jgi:dihydroorotate dehydrogenase (NAD+) catalytic subunit
MADTKASLEVGIGRTRLSTPLIGASGLFGYGDEYLGVLDYNCFGAIVCKTITLDPREGNRPPRIVDVESGIINSIGLENIGSEAFLDKRLAELDLPCKLFVSIGGGTVDEYRKLAQLLDGAAGVEALEVNISCPNVKKGGIAFGSDPDSTRQVIGAVRSETSMTLMAKVPPLIAGILPVCEAACDAGADALTIANTYPAMAIDLDQQRPVLGAVSGGLSGGAIKPVTMFLVWKAARSLEVPVIASGGIETADDAVEYMLAGAHAIQIGSAVLNDTGSPSRIIEGIKTYMASRSYEKLGDFRSRSVKEEA